MIDSRMQKKRVFCVIQVWTKVATTNANYNNFSIRWRYRFILNVNTFIDDAWTSLSTNRSEWRKAADWVTGIKIVKSCQLLFFCLKCFLSLCVWRELDRLTWWFDVCLSNYSWQGFYFLFSIGKFSHHTCVCNKRLIMRVMHGSNKTKRDLV